MAAPTGAMLLPAETKIPTSSLFTTPPHNNYSKNPLVLTVRFWYNRGKKMAYKPSEIPATPPIRFIPAYRKETPQ